MAENMENRDFDYQGMVILGASGNIGTRLVERVTESDYPQGEHHPNPDLLENKNPIPHKHPTKIIAISDSTKYFVNINGIAADELRNKDLVSDKIKSREEYENEAEYQSTITKANVKRILAEKGTAHGGNLTAIPSEVKKQILEATPPPIEEANIGYVDLTDSQNTRELYDHVINDTQSAVVAVSKKVLGYASKENFDRYKNTGRIEYLPTVGAGSDAIAHLANYPESRERLKRVEAMVSGTNLSICKGLESEEYQRGEIELSDLIEQAWKAGDTEPYADTDVGESESDTWVKARIMAMSAGLQALPENIKAGLPFVPKFIGEQFSKETMEDYLQAIREKVDQPFREEVQKLITKTRTVRHIARITFNEDGTESISVGLEQVPRDSEFATSEQNVIIIEDDTETVILKKPGAGRDVTCKSIEQAFRNLVPRGLERMVA